MADLRVIAYEEGSSWGKVLSMIEERECDPNPGQYSLRYPSNGALHRNLRNFDTKVQLYDAAQEEGFNVIRVGKHTQNRLRKADG